MRFRFRYFAPFLLLAALAAPALITGCRTQNTTVNNQQDPPDYRQWEQETRRQHVDLDKRSPAEQKEFRDWERSHNDHHS